MKFEVISFYTENSPYEKEAEYFKKNLQSINISTDHIVKVPNLKNWHNNCCRKPFFIHEKLVELNKPVVWVDIDARFVKYPILFDTLADSHYDMSCHFHQDQEVLSGTLFFRPTPNVYKVIFFWKELLKQDFESEPNTPQIWPGLEQSALEYILTKKRDHFAVKNLNLPKSYIYIRDLPWWSDCKDPYIVHGQASRIYKKEIDG